jgi:hypothetical protein
LDWSLPEHGWRRAAWRRGVGAIEPNGAVDVLDGCVPADLEAAGLKVTSARPSFEGRAWVLVAVRR